MSCCVWYTTSLHCGRTPPAKMMTSVNLPTSELRYSSRTRSRMPPGYLLWAGLARKQLTSLWTHSSFPSFALTCTSSHLQWSKVMWLSLSLSCQHQSQFPAITAILFWLNCKSVYSYWQHQRRMLNNEVHVHLHVLYTHTHTHGHTYRSGKQQRCL